MSIVNLTTPVADAVRPTSQWQAGLDEWIRLHCTGAAVGYEVQGAAKSITLPEVNVRFDQDEYDEEDTTKPVVHVTAFDNVPERCWHGPTRDAIVNRLSLRWTVKVWNVGQRQRVADFLCQQIVDGLVMLIQSDSSIALSAIGLMRMRVRRGGLPSSGTRWQTRSFVTTGELRYEL